VAAASIGEECSASHLLPRGHRAWDERSTSLMRPNGTAGRSRHGEPQNQGSAGHSPISMPSHRAPNFCAVTTPSDRVLYGTNGCTPVAVSEGPGSRPAARLGPVSTSPIPSSQPGFSGGLLAIGLSGTQEMARRMTGGSNGAANADPIGIIFPPTPTSWRLPLAFGARQQLPGFPVIQPGERLGALPQKRRCGFVRTLWCDQLQRLGGRALSLTPSSQLNVFQLQVKADRSAASHRTAGRLEIEAPRFAN